MSKLFKSFLAALLLSCGLAQAATIESFGGACDGVTDNTPALNLAIAAAPTSVDRTVTFGACSYLFKSPPNPITDGLHLVGVDKASSVLEAAFNGGTFLYFTGANGSGGGVHNLALYSMPGFTPGNAIMLQGNATTQPDMWQGEHIYITGPGLWANDFVAIGNARTSPQGVREVSLTDVQVFNATGTSIWLSNVVAFHMYGGGVYQAQGTAAAQGIWITGTGTAATNSTLNDFHGVDNNGQLNITNSTIGTYIGGEVGMLNTDTSSYWRIETHDAGAAINNLTHSVVSLN